MKPFTATAALKRPNNENKKGDIQESQGTEIQTKQVDIPQEEIQQQGTELITIKR